MQTKPSDWVGEEESRALADVQRRSGRDFPRIQSATVTSKEEASLVFPVLAEWAKQGSPPIRAAVITCFDSKFARSYLDFLLDRWEVEDYSVASDLLAQIVAKLVDNRRALRALEIARHKNDSSVCRVLTKLTGLRATEGLAREWILADFGQGRVPHYRLIVYSRIKDPKIQACYEAYVDDPDRYTRTLARRVLGKSAPKAEDLVKSPAGPPRGEPYEVYSIELDIGKARPILEAIAERFRLTIPPSVLDGTSLEVLVRNKWHKLRGPEPGSGYQLWFRQEDFDIVEVVVTA